MERKKKIVKKLIPVGNVIVIRHDKPLEKSTGGILLPDDSKTETATGIIVAMPEKMKENDHDHPYKEGDRIVYNLNRRLAYNNDPRDRHFLIYADSILAVEEEEELDDTLPEDDADADRSNSDR